MSTYTPALDTMDRHIPVREDILKLAYSNPIVHTAYQFYESEMLNYEQMLIVCVVALADTIESFKERLMQP